MKLLLDPQIFEQRFGGISRYYAEIYRYFKNKGDTIIHCPMLFSENLHLQHYSLQPKLLTAFFNNRLIKKYVSKSFLYNKNKLLTSKILGWKTHSLFIPTYYGTYFLKDLNDTPFVLTVYDMIHELFPEYFLNDSITSPQKKTLIEKASKIIAISENTKKDILKFYPLTDPEKIKVIYLNHSIDTKNEAKNINTIMNGKKYILFVGNRYGYKNFTWFAQSISGWLLEKNINLLCLGGFALNEKEKHLIDSLGINKLVTQYNFKDNELAQFYTNAIAFIFPSLYEGFGIPVLEAMFCECPVLLPATSSFPEVAGDAGIYFQLDKPATLTDALDKLLKDDVYKKNTISSGKKQSALFSWSNTMEQVLEVYGEVLSSKPA